MTQNENQTLGDRALELLEAGFRPIPLGGYDEAPPDYFIKRFDGDVQRAREEWPKTPRVPWKIYQASPPTEEDVTLWWERYPGANIAILTGHEVLVVDADSIAATKWVEKNLPVTPWRVSTSRGMHFYYGVSVGAPEVSNFVGKNVKVDIRGAGGYVVAAGSRHSSGILYQDDRLPNFDCDYYTDLPDLSSSEITKIRIHNSGGSLPEERDQLPEGTYADMRQYVAENESVEIGEAVDEGSRNIECARLAGLYFRQGYAINETITRCLYWNENNNPPLEGGELLRVVESVSKTHLRKTGVAIPEEPAPEKRIESLMFKFGELIDDPPEPPEEFWGEKLLFRGSRFMIAGAPKIGKSRFTLAMAVSACVGGRFLNNEFKKPLKFLWMQAEIHKSWLLDRVGQVTRGFSTEEMSMVRENLVLSGRLDIDLKGSERDYEKVRQVLLDYRPDIWAIDPVIDFSTAEENSNVDVRALMRRVNALATEFDCAVILVHHTKKPAANGAIDFDGIRGASAFRGWFDTGAMLTGESTDPLVSWEARNTVSPLAHRAAFNDATGRYEASIIESEEFAAEEKSVGDLNYSRVYDLLKSSEGQTMTMQLLIDTAMLKFALDAGAARRAIASMLSETSATVETCPDRGPVYRA